MIETYNLSVRQENIKLVEFSTRKSGKRILAKRVRLRNNILTRLRQKFLSKKIDSNNLVKKSVRVDSDIYNALHNVARNNEIFFTNIINSAVINEISTRQIDLINDSRFKHKITVYFTQEEYRRVEEVIKELKDRRLKGITFSSLIRSILYKYLGIAMESSIYAEYERLNRRTQANNDNDSGMATNPIHLNKKQQNKSNKKIMKGTCYGRKNN